MFCSTVLCYSLSCTFASCPIGPVLCLADWVDILIWHVDWFFLVLWTRLKIKQYFQGNKFWSPNLRLINGHLDASWFRSVGQSIWKYIFYLNEHLTSNEHLSWSNCVKLCNITHHWSAGMRLKVWIYWPSECLDKQICLMWELVLNHIGSSVWPSLLEPSSHFFHLAGTTKH